MKANIKQKNTMQESTNNIIRFLTCACTIFPGMKIKALLKTFNSNHLTTKTKISTKKKYYTTIVNIRK